MKIENTTYVTQQSILLDVPRPLSWCVTVFASWFLLVYQLHYANISSRSPPCIIMSLCPDDLSLSRKFTIL